MPFSSIAAYIRPEFPQFTEDETNIGNTWQYRGPTATIFANKPVIGDAWADGRSVRSVEYTPSLDNSGVSDLIISTVFSYADSVTIATTLDSVRYQIRWVPQDLPLFQHPSFAPGAASDLYAAASGTPPRTGFADCMGWEDEDDSIIKGNRQYKQRLNGIPSGSAITVAIGGAPAYVKLRQLGFESYTVFLPVWTKVSTYSGTAAPGTGSCGQYTASPDGSGFPTGYDWIKSGDTAERVGNRPRWTRTEEWQGFTRVYYDTDTLNPVGYTLP